MSTVIYTLYAQGLRFVESHISRKTSEIWATRHSLRIEISPPDHRLPRAVREKLRLEMGQATL